MRLAIILSSFFGMTAVMLGASTSHLAGDQLSTVQLSWLETGIKYQMWHSLALLGIGCLVGQYESALLRLSIWLFAGGILLFSGGLYLITFTSVTTFSHIIPLGGLCLILAWGLLMLAGIKISKRNK